MATPALWTVWRPSTLSRLTPAPVNGADRKDDRNSGAGTRETTAGSTSGDQKTSCAKADKSGVAGKSQPPLPLCLRMEGGFFGSCGQERLVVPLIGFVTPQTLPGEPFDG